MRCVKRLSIVLAACLTLASCSSSPKPSNVPPQLPPVYPAALMQLCPPPTAVQGASADEVARALFEMYGVYGQCAGMHAELLRWIEGGQ